MKKICFITQGELPVPAKKGGAVETLVEYIINQNEENYNFDIDILTVNDKLLNDVKLNHANLIKFEKKNTFLEKIWNLVYRVLKKVFKFYIPYSVVSKNMLSFIKNEGSKYDYVIYEAGPTTQIPLLAKYLNKENFLVHLHWDGCANKQIDEKFGYLIPVSSYIGKNWQKNSGCNNDKIKVLRNCAPVELFSKEISIEEKEALKKELHIDSAKKVIIFTGRIVWEKGVKELITALKMVNTKDVCLLIIGSANFGNKTNTKYEKEVQELVKESSIQIIFTGFIHQTELYKYYNIADVAIMPSQFEDPAPLVSIETQATGTPLIATRVGGIPEYVTNESAILITKDMNQEKNIAEAIDLLLDNEDRRKLMSEAGKNNAQQYTVSHFYSDFVNLINGLGKYE